jgi:hypothetical protein
MIELWQFVMVCGLFMGHMASCEMVGLFLATTWTSMRVDSLVCITQKSAVHLGFS